MRSVVCQHHLMNVGEDWLISDGGSRLETVSTWFAIVASAATVVAAVVAVVTLLALRADSRDRTRPRVIADLRGQVITHSATLVVSNVGSTPAEQVRVEFDPPLPEDDIESGVGATTAVLQRRYALPIPTLAPGSELRNVYQGLRGGREPVPDDFVVKCDYQDSHGRRYSESFKLSMAPIRGATFQTPGDKSASGLLERTAVALERIAEAIGVR